MTAETGGAAYFSWDNLAELAGFESHLSFAEEMIGKYQWRPETRNRFQKLLGRIREKQRDEQLNLSVIGEFSTGKSTFINALLRTELLASSALQGTTAACTVIEYGVRPGVRLTERGGHIEAFVCGSTEELAQRLLAFTTEPESARRLHSVQVYLPSQTLRSGFRIIDTPGTNALELWHEEVTIRAIQEFSDLSIILVDATKPMPESLCCFVEENLDSVLHQCVFLVTKLDLILERERQRMLAYVAMKLKQRLELEKPVVLAYDAPSVLRDAAGAADLADAALLQTSYQNESALLRHMKRQKALAQTKKVLTLIGEMYQAINGQLNGLSEKYENDLATLLRSRQKDLSDFVQRQKSVRLAAWTDQVGAVRAKIRAKICYHSVGAQLDVTAELDRQNSLDALKAFVNSSLAYSCARGANQVAVAAQQSFAQVGELLEEEIGVFRQAFKREFHDLSVLEGAAELEYIPIEPAARVSMEGMDAAGKYVAEELARENRAFFGGAAAGAAVGTAILPGAGTLIGALLGGVGGSFFAPGLSEVKASSKEKLRAPMQNYFYNVEQRCISALDSYIEQAEKSLLAELDRYLFAYQRTVDQRITEETDKRKRIEKRIQAVRDDMQRIEQRKFQLGSLREQLDRAGRRDV